MQSGIPAEQMRYQGSLDCAKKIYREEGLRAFYKGGMANAFRATGSALVLVFYDLFQKHFIQ